MNVIRIDSLSKISDIAIDYPVDYYLASNLNLLEERRLVAKPELFPKYVKIFIKTDLIPHSLDFLKRIPNKYHLLTGASDICITKNRELVSEIFNQTNIASWVGNNLEEIHPSMLSIPIGFTRTGYEEDWDSLLNFKKKIPKEINILLTWMGDTSIERNIVRDLAYKTNSKRIFIQNSKLEYKDYVELLKKSHYVICPEGNGIDTHRIYETIFADAVPIVLNSPLWRMHRNLGCLIVNKWSDIFSLPIFPITPNNNKHIKLVYWIQRIYKHHFMFSY